MRTRSTWATLATGAALVTGVLAVPPSAQATVAPHAVPRATPTWTAHTRSLGAAASGAAVTARVYLAPRGGVAAQQAAATAVSTPGSATYHHFLTAAQYRARYQPTTASVRSVDAWLRSSGLRVTAVEAHHRYVAVSGTVAQANSAFATTIARYQHDGRSVQAPASQVKVPAALASSVLTVTGLDTTPHIMKTSAAPPAAFRNAHPCSRTFGQITAKYQADFHTPLPQFRGSYLPYVTCGYTGPQYRSAYEGDTGLDGTGVTVAITDAYASPLIASDANTYASNHGDGSYATGQLTQVKPTAKYNRGSQCGPSGWYGEETLDVEAVHAMAPGAKIRYYPSASCFDDDFLADLANVVEQDKVQLVSNSWGDLEQNEGDTVPAYEDVFLQGALEGISFLYSSGDHGDDLAYSGIKQVDYPTSDPYVTSVGGTSDAIGADGKFAFQTGWGTQQYNLSSDGQSWNGIGFTSGAGGGESGLFNQPDYQQGVTPGPYRGVPDVGLDADPNTGMLIGITQTFPDGSVHYDEYRLGGTSLASPLFAGMTALTLQNAGTGVGLLNPSIYDDADTGQFTDVPGTTPSPVGIVRVNFANSVDASQGLTYSVRQFNQDASLKTATGWDEVTGVGSPNPNWLDAFGTS